MKLCGMEANNLGTNTATGWVIWMSENTQFDYNTQFNGFVAHVINLAAKEVLNVFGQVLDDDESEMVSNIHDLVNPPPPM